MNSKNIKMKVMHSKLRSYLFIVSLSLLSMALFSCSSKDDDNNDGGGGSGTPGVNAISIRATSTGPETFLLITGEAGNNAKGVHFCYPDKDCKNVWKGSIKGVHSGQTFNLEISPRGDGMPNGVKANIFIQSGSGYFEVVEGRSYDDDGWEEFEAGKVLYKSEEFTTSGIIDLTWGDTSG